MGTVVVAQKEKPKPPPPPLPQFTLASGLNIVTSELSRQLRAWQAGDSNITQEWAETRTDYVRDIALADVDLDGQNELIMPGACSDAAGVVYVWLAAYKQGVAGETSAGRCDPEQRVQAGFVYPEIAGYDVDDGAS